MPVTGSHASTVQGLPSSMATGVPPEHAPAWHVSPVVQAFPSLHDVPFETPVCETPVTASQASAVHGSPSSVATGAPPVHVPVWHASPVVQTVPSLHEVPLALFV